MVDIGEWFARQRARRAWLDHSVSAYERMDEVRGSWIAGSLTYTTFLAIFPILLVAYSILGAVLRSNEDALEKVQQYLEENLPFVDVTAVTSAGLTTGLIGAAGMLLTGVNWVSGVREGVRGVFHAPASVEKGNAVLAFLRAKLRDAFAFFSLLLVVAISAAVSFALAALIKWLFAQTSTPLTDFLDTPVFAFVMGVVFDAVLVTMLIRVIPRISVPLRKLWLPLLVTAVAVGVLKLLAGVLVASTQHNPAYAVVAAAVGLLIFLNLFYRIIVTAASWLATDPGVDVPSTSEQNEGHGS